jgi:hypothetical protein
MSVGPPSFLFSSLDPETFSLFQELESLGGGDAKIATVEHYGLVFPSKRKKKEDSQTLWTYDHSLGLREICYPKDASRQENMKYYSMNGSSCIQEDENIINTEIGYQISEKVSNWINDGYNTCLLNFGMRNNDKTKTFFNHLGHKSAESSSSDPSLTSFILQNIYHYKKKHENEFLTTIGVSCWILKDHHNNKQQLIDLMIPHSPTSQQPLEFTIINCPTFEIAMEVIHNARNRGKGCLSFVSNSEGMSEDDKAHFFLRIFTHKQPAPKKSSTPKPSFASGLPTNLRENIEKNDFFSTQGEDKGILACFYLIDLIGFTSIDTKYFDHLHTADKIIIRERNAQLQVLQQLFQQMVKVSSLSPRLEQKAAAPTTMMTSARDSKLTTILAPILQGNTKIFVVSFYRQGEAAYPENKQLLNALENISKIKTPVFPYKVKAFFAIFIFDFLFL